MRPETKGRLVVWVKEGQVLSIDGECIKITLKRTAKGKAHLCLEVPVSMKITTQKELEYSNQN